MQDDILDLTSAEFTEKKGGLGADITEGKRTLMVIHTLKVAQTRDRKRLVEILGLHTLDQKLKDEAIEIMKKNGSIDYVKQFAIRIVKESWKDVEKLLRPSEAKEKLNAFATFLVERRV
jgi:geranylgeranyl pyrophosphate synthase